MKRKILTAIKLIIIGLIFYYISIFFAENFYEVQQLDIHFNYVSLLLSFLFVGLHIFNNSLIWQFITKKNNCHVSLEKGIVFWLYAELGKFVPGKIFLLASKIYLYNKEGKSKIGVTLSFFLEITCTMLASAFIFVFSLLFVSIDMVENFYFYICLLIMLFFVIINPTILEFISNYCLRILKRDEIKLEITYKNILYITGFYTANFFVQGIGLFFLINSIYEMSFSNIIFVTAAISVAGMLGVLSLFAPSGIGVREGVLIFALKHIIPNSISVIISLVARIWQTGMELLLILAAFVYAKAKGSELGVDYRAIQE